MKILHIAAHVGGGIGSAYIGLKAGTDQQSILLLEKPLDTVTLSRVRNAGFRIILDADREQVYIPGQQQEHLFHAGIHEASVQVESSGRA